MPQIQDRRNERHHTLKNRRNPTEAVTTDLNGVLKACWVDTIDFTGRDKQLVGANAASSRVAVTA